MTKLTLADGSQYDLTVAGFSYADNDKKTVISNGGHTGW